MMDKTKMIIQVTVIKGEDLKVICSVQSRITVFYKYSEAHIKIYSLQIMWKSSLILT